MKTPLREISTDSRVPHILLPKESLQMGSNHLGTVHGMFLAMSHTVWLLNLISVEMWSNLVSEHIFVHVFHHRPPRKYAFFCLLCEFSMERFQAHVITSSSVIHSTPQPPSQLRNCLAPPCIEAGIQLRKIHGCHVAMHLISCHRRSIL